MNRTRRITGQRLCMLRDEDGRDYDMIADIVGRGFKVRGEDIRRLLRAAGGRVASLTMTHLPFGHTRIRENRVR